MAANVCVRERGRIDLCLDLKMEPKALEGIWVCAPSSDRGAEGGRLARSPRSLFSAPLTSRPFRNLRGPEAAWLTHLPGAELRERLHGGSHPVPVFKMSAIKGGKSSNVNLITCHRSNLP